MDTEMQALDAADSRRQDEGYVYELVHTGPSAGTWRPIPLFSTESGYYYPGTMMPMFGSRSRAALFDEELAVAAGLFDGDPYLPRDYLLPVDDHLPGDGHRRSSKRVRVAAASEAILQEVTASDALQSECAICLQDFHANETLRAMPCSHAFHQNCISQWLHRKVVCPLCRYQLPEEEEDDDQIAS